MALGATQPLIGVPEGYPGGKKRPVHNADNLTTTLGHCHVIWEP